MEIWPNGVTIAICGAIRACLESDLYVPSFAGSSMLKRMIVVHRKNDTKRLGSANPLSQLNWAALIDSIIGLSMLPKLERGERGSPQLGAGARWF